MADSAKRQQSGTRKPGRPKGSTSKQGTSSAKKGGTSRSSGSRGGRGSKQAYQDTDTGFMKAEAVVILSFAIAILLFLSNFRLCGVVGDVLRSLQLGIFGMVGYLVPILLFVGTCFHLSNQGNIHAAMKLAAVVGLVITVCGLLQLLFGAVSEDGGMMFYYTQSSLNGRGGGLLGGAVSGLLRMAVGQAGAYLVLIVLLILCIVCITEKSFVSAVRKGSGKAYQYAREDMDRRRELHAQRAEERRLLREEQKVRGVNLDATWITAPEEEWEGEYEAEPAYEEGAEAFEEPYDAEAEDFPREMDQSIIQRHGKIRNVIREQPAGRPGRVKTENPADQFRGRIALPPEYEEETAPEPENDSEVSALARSLEGMSRREEKPVAAGVRVLEEEEEEYETIHAARDARTLEELDMAAPVSFEEDLEEAAPWEDPEPELETEIPPVPVQPAERIQPVISREPEREPEENPWDPVYDETPSAIPEESFNYDSVFVPEEPKRVVTASGKVIETETELLQKKLEKKNEKKSQPQGDDGSGEVSVLQEIKAKEEAVKKEYIFPPTTLLKRAVKNPGAFSENEYKATAIKLQQTLHNFGVGVTVTNISCGPAVTRYELLPEQGVKVSKIVGLADDIKLSLAAADIRIEAPIPGKSAVGIEVPNKENNTVYLRELLESDAFTHHKSRLAFAVGKDIGGQVVVTDIAKMPHLLIAGATGSGKSVCINTLIMSIIFKADPNDVKLIMVDPKVVELSVYNGIPHLLIPVVTDPKKASGALNWAVAEMTDRYKKFAECNVRDLKGYNDRVEKLHDIEDEKKPQKLPQIIIIIDELADLMMVAPGEVEDSICRLAQLARAAGIHLVIATQRPSVNVITGLIKANVPSRIAFSVSSGVDSRTIIDMNGAEKLLGKGDMLFYPAGFPKPQRVQGAFVSDDEVSNVVEFLTEQGMVAQYSTEVESRVASPSMDGSGGSGSRDDYFVQAGQFIIEKDKASIGMLQRMFKIGFNRAARIMDQLAEAGVVGEEEGTKPRKILMSMEQFEEMLEQGR